MNISKMSKIDNREREFVGRYAQDSRRPEEGPSHSHSDQASEERCSRQWGTCRGRWSSRTAICQCQQLRLRKSKVEKGHPHNNSKSKFDLVGRICAAEDGNDTHCTKRHVEQNSIELHDDHTKGTMSVLPNRESNSAYRIKAESLDDQRSEGAYATTWESEYFRSVLSFAHRRPT